MMWSPAKLQAFAKLHSEASKDLIIASRLWNPRLSMLQHCFRVIRWVYHSLSQLIWSRLQKVKLYCGCEGESPDGVRRDRWLWVFYAMKSQSWWHALWGIAPIHGGQRYVSERSQWSQKHPKACTASNDIFKFGRQTIDVLIVNK